jgi:hypothetical protein
VLVSTPLRIYIHIYTDIGIQTQKHTHTLTIRFSFPFVGAGLLCLLQPRTMPTKRAASHQGSRDKRSSTMPEDSWVLQHARSMVGASHALEETTPHASRSEQTGLTGALPELRQLSQRSPSPGPHSGKGWRLVDNLPRHN